MARIVSLNDTALNATGYSLTNSIIKLFSETTNTFPAGISYSILLIARLSEHLHKCGAIHKTVARLLL